MPDNSSLVSLARGLAHNFNNSLTGISGSVQIAMMDEIPETTRSALTNAMKSAERMANLVRQLLEFSRAGDIKRNEFPVSGLGILFRELNAAAPERFAIDLPPIRFYGDEVKILMMLRMLVGRAAEVLEGIENGRAAGKMPSSSLLRTTARPFPKARCRTSSSRCSTRTAVLRPAT